MNAPDNKVIFTTYVTPTSHYIKKIKNTYQEGGSTVKYNLHKFSCKNLNKITKKIKKSRKIIKNCNFNIRIDGW